MDKFGYRVVLTGLCALLPLFSACTGSDSSIGLNLEEQVATDAPGDTDTNQPTNFLGGPDVSQTSSDSSEFTGISSIESSLGLILVEADTGRTLYTFQNDPNNISTCTGTCAVIWQPLLANGAQQFNLSAEQSTATAFSTITGLGIVTRPDGLLQWSFSGAPLYRFTGDSAEGDVNGEAQDNVWYVARPFPWQLMVDASGVEFFSGRGSANTGLNDPALRDLDLDGLSLYTFTDDNFGLSTCNLGCVEERPPLFADRGARVSGGFTVITRENGAGQWAYNGEPLYFFVGDETPGDTTGDGSDGVWFLARP